MNASPRPAGLWQRSVAWSLDAALLGPLSLLLTCPVLGPRTAMAAQQTSQLMHAIGQAIGRAIIDGAHPLALGLVVMHDAALRQAIAGLEAALWSLAWPPMACFIGLSAIYHVAFECGLRQATPGQRAMGLRVTDAGHQRLRPAGALLRHVAGAASWLSLNVGHLMAAAPPTHLALHDRLSRTRVWAEKSRLPAWAVAWLALLAVGQLGLIAWWMSAAMTTMQAALEQALW